MTLPQLAAYLNVRERTIYDWAQREVVPAYKIGGAWRFRRDEIDAWLITRRTGPSVSSPRQSCSVCSRTLGPSVPFGASCEHPDCENPICSSCWGVLLRRRCPAHPATPVRSFRAPSSEPAADPPLGDDAYPSGAHPSEEYDENVVSLLRARFMDGFCHRVEDRPYLMGADGNTIARVNNWRRVRQTGAEEPEGRRSGKSASSSAGRLRTLDWVTYNIAVSGGALDRTRGGLRLEARVVSPSPPRTILGQGRPGPVSAEDLNRALNDVTTLARRERVTYVLGLYSDQGWSEEAQRLFNHPSAQERFVNPNLSVAIVGEGLSQVLWNSSDPVMGQLGFYFSETFDEELTECRDRIREIMRKTSVYLASRVEDEEGFPPNVAREAIASLSSNNEIEMVTENGESAIVRKE